VLRVGLTGGIGAGKSTVAARLAGHGAVVVDADRLAREVVAPGTEGLGEVVRAFGDGVLQPDGSLDRPALGRLVFADEQSRLRLNAITHPRIAQLTAQAIAAAGPEAVIVHDVPLLVENRMGARYHLVAVVDAPAQERVHRLVTSRGLAEADAWARVRAQADDAARRAAADVWLDNAGAGDALLAQVDALWADRLVRFDRNLRLGHAAARPDQYLVVGPDPDWPAQAARLLDRIGAALAGLDPMRLIRVYSTFPLGEAALDPALRNPGLILTIGCCLYLATGAFLGMVFHMILGRWFENASALRASILSRASFFALSKAFSAPFACTDNSASCSESGFICSSFCSSFW